MPIKIPADLPATETLHKENIFVMTESRATTQDIRPLKILLLNLMPTKIATETQLARLLGNSPLQVDMEFLQTASHTPKNTSAEHMISFYKHFEDVKDNKYDGLIITGAPVEQMPFEEVEYWDELCRIMEWSKTNVTSTFHICWGAQAGLYYHYGIQKYPLDKKLFGVFLHKADYLVESCKLLAEKHPELKILASSEEAGVYAVATERGKQIFITGHSEYDADTLKNEYLRDKNAGLPIDVPKNYFPNDDDTKEPVVRWRSHANLIYSNWLNYFVYQITPFNIDEING